MRLMEYYVFKSGFNCGNPKTVFIKVIDKKHTITVHVERKKINLIKTDSFKQNYPHDVGKVYDTIYGPCIYMKRTTEKIFNRYYDSIRDNCHMCYRMN